MRLERRVERLEAEEAREREQRGCQGCGHTEGAQPTFQIVFGEAGGRERCGACGRRLVFRIEFDRSG